MKKLAIILGLLLLPTAVLGYTVQSGDTLSKIASKVGVTWQELWKLNEMTVSNPDLIHPGQELVTGDVLGAGYNPVTGYQSRTSQYISASATTIPVVSTKDKAGVQIDLTNISSSGTVKVYMNIDAGTPNEEPVICTGVTTVSWTGCTRGISFQGSSESASTTLQKAHNAGTPIIITNIGQFYNQYVSVDGNQTINDLKTFTLRPQIPSDTDTATTTAFVTFGQLSRQAISGAANGSTAVKGIYQEATASEYLLGTKTGSTGADLVVTPDVLLTYSTTHRNNGVPYGGSISAGDFLYVSSTGYYFKALATNESNANGVIAYAYDNGSLNTYGRTLFPGSIIFAGSGMTPGQKVYLSDTGTASTTAGTYRKVLGVALGATYFQFNPMVDEVTSVPTASVIPLSNTSGYLDGWTSGVVNNYVAGEAINASSVPLAVYLNSTDGRVYKTSSAVATTTFTFIGFAQYGQNKTAGQNVLIQTAGLVNNFSGLATGTLFYLSTAGTVSSTAGTVNYKIGKSNSPTSITIEKGKKIVSGTLNWNTQTTPYAASSTVNTGFKPARISLYGCGFVNSVGGDTCTWTMFNGQWINGTTLGWSGTNNSGNAIPIQDTTYLVNFNNTQYARVSVFSTSESSVILNIESNTDGSAHYSGAKLYYAIEE